MHLMEKSKLGKIVRRLREMAYRRIARASRATIPPQGCIARQYAQCSDFAHCPCCSTVEQTLRAAYWAKLKWPRVGGRNSF